MAPKPFFNGDFVLVDLEAPDKWALIERMIDQLMENPEIRKQSGMSREVIHQAVTDREKDRATGLANGFEFRHVGIVKVRDAWHGRPRRMHFLRNGLANPRRLFDPHGPPHIVARCTRHSKSAAWR